MNCKLCPSTELVYSGIDAFLLGVPTETYCYSCANYIAQKNRESESATHETTILTTSC